MNDLYNERIDEMRSLELRVSDNSPIARVQFALQHARNTSRLAAYKRKRVDYDRMTFLVDALNRMGRRLT